MATPNLNEPTSASSGNIPYIGAEANDNTGNTIRESFKRINDRLKEIFGSQNSSNVIQTPFVSGDNIQDDTIDSQHYAAGSIDEEHLNASNDPSPNQVLQWDGGTGFTWVDQFDGDITSVVAGDGLTGGATDGDATLNADVDDSTISLTASNGTGQLRIKDNGVNHDQLAARYTEDVVKSDTSGTGASAVELDWSAGSVFKFSNSLTGAIDLKFANYKLNQVVDIFGLTGSQTITLDSSASGAETFKRIGSQQYDGTADNHIQVICLDDSASTPIFHYAIGTTTEIATP